MFTGDAAVKNRKAHLVHHAHVN